MVPDLFPSTALGKDRLRCRHSEPAHPGDGNVPSAITDLRDIGRYVARIAKDDRTVNRYVLAYNELWTQHQIYDILERLSGEKLERRYVTREELDAAIKQGQIRIESDPALAADFGTLLSIVGSQYQISWGIRGDNTPEYAKYLGYLTSKELYPDFQPISFEDYLKEVLSGSAKIVYEDFQAYITQAMKTAKS